MTFFKKLRKPIAAAMAVAMAFSVSVASAADVGIVAISADLAPEGMYSVPLPSDALLSNLWVNSPVRGNAGEDSGNNPNAGFYTWMYQTNMRSFASGTAAPQYLIYGDRGFAPNQEARGGDGLNNFIIRQMPDFLEGAHFLQIANDGRNPAHASVTNADAPYIQFTAAVDIYAFLGVDMRIRDDAYLYTTYLPNSAWEFMGADYFIENNETNAAAAHANRFDPTFTMVNYMPIRFYLHRMFVAAGETVSIPTPGTGNPMITLAFLPAGANAEPAGPVTDRMFEVPLPADALLSNLWVRSAPVPHNDAHANIPLGPPTFQTVSVDRWAYLTDMTAIAEGFIHPSRGVFGDRASNRWTDAYPEWPVEGDGYFAMTIRQMPAFLEGAHYLRMATDARGSNHWSVTGANDQTPVGHPDLSDAPYVAFVAAQDITVVMGVQHSVQPTNSIFDFIEEAGFEFMGPDYFIRLNNRANWAHPNPPGGPNWSADNPSPAERAVSVFDPNLQFPLAPQPQHPYRQAGPYVFFLHTLELAAGEKLMIPSGASGDDQIAQITLAFVPAAPAPTPTPVPTPAPTPVPATPAPTPVPAPADITAGMYAYPLPADALLSALWVRSPIEPHNAGHANVFSGGVFHSINRWAYMTNMAAIPSGYIPPYAVMVGDRATNTNNDDPEVHIGRPVTPGAYGYRAFGMRYIPSFLEGAHFIRMATDARGATHATVTNHDAPYLVFTAAQDIVAYLGVGHRILAGDAFLGWMADNNFEFMGPNYFIENNEGANWAMVDGARATSVFDPNFQLPLYPNEANPYRMRGPVRYYLHSRTIAAGETVVIPLPSTSISLAFTPVAGEEVAPVVETPATPAPAEADRVNPPTGDNSTIIFAVGAGVLLVAAIAFVIYKKKATNN